eukprot:TRINITY_DN30336_c0_g1_i1.p1 TRINITY_DN30336_c0_g1~~TRINITY_DN30336_c0_g1_i1.p1  ORF type:complete len:299 (+),score=88.88 TRINITY_DN30336_c0_g1_i1:54-950(+)
MAGDLGFTAPTVGMLGVASLLVLIAAATVCDEHSTHCEDQLGWAVACSAISLVFCLVYLILWYVKGKVDWIPDGMPQMVCVVFWTLWWACGAGVLTFDLPFQIPGNGYFGAWAAFLICATSCYNMFPQAQQAKGILGQAGDEQLYILFASIVLLIQASIDCDRRHKCKDEDLWAVLCAVFTFIIAIVNIFASSKLPPLVAGTIMPLLQLAFWASGWGVLTYRRPYIGVGNGYFACLLGFLFSAKLCIAALGGAASEFVDAKSGSAHAAAPQSPASPAPGWNNESKPVEGSQPSQGVPV